MLIFFKIMETLQIFGLQSLLDQVRCRHVYEFVNAELARSQGLIQSISTQHRKVLTERFSGIYSLATSVQRLH